MLKATVNEVSLFTLVAPTTTPPPLMRTVVSPGPGTKFVPVMVTVTLVPRTPLFGDMAVMVGVASPTVNFTGLLVPRELVTVTSREPGGALRAMVNVAVKEESLTTETLLLVTPPSLMLTVGVPTVPVKLDPLIVT